MLAAPRFGGLLVAGWLAGIILNLLLVGGYGDIALRDFGLLVGALAPVPAGLRRKQGSWHERRTLGSRWAGPAAPGRLRAMHLDLPSLETSFDLVAPRGDELMDVFYARLFAAAPAVRPLFAGTDLRRQKGMLLGALVLLRKSLRDLDRIVPALREMGARHVRYGARPEHYPVVGEVLIASMAEIAGDDWRHEYAAAWAAAYGIVAATMIEGAASAEMLAA